MNNRPNRVPILQLVLSAFGKRRPGNSLAQASQRSIVPQRPGLNDHDAWRDYWRALGQPWRTQPEIDKERQKYLAERRRIPSDILQGVYSFKNILLKRADVEWLLATHDGGHGSVNWSDESQRKRQGVDLRGANLHEANLLGLPLACTRFGLNRYERLRTSAEQNETAGAIWSEFARSHVYLGHILKERIYA